MFAPLPRILRGAAEALADLLFPPHCALCLCRTRGGEHLCADCRKAAPAIAAPFCQTCSMPHAGDISGPFTCAQCRDRRFHFTCAVARYQSKGVVRELVHRFKYQRHYHLRRVLAGWLTEALDDARLQTPPCDAIVPVPLHPVRRRERGFNQARVLAEELSRQSGIPLCDCLRRIRPTPSQTAFDRQARIENLRGAFRMRQNANVRNLHLLLVDDILTTGSTVDECARVLMGAGAASVRVATVARA